jgi:hypothetical protein
MTTKNSDLIANLEALPQVANNASELGGRIRIAQGNVALAAGDSTDDDIVMLAPVPTHATQVLTTLAAPAPTTLVSTPTTVWLWTKTRWQPVLPTRLV